jgi:dTDP-4-amino-4,6-dideoxy-D-glucose/dTDP-4-amino-2,4-dideoxy-beta-L-xylose transaminase
MKNIPLFKVFMSPTAKNEVGKILDSGYIGQGPQVDKFETSLKEYLNQDLLVTLNSGTSALHLALHLLKKPVTNQKNWNGVVGWDQIWPGIQEGDEILCTSLTCTASNFPVLANGFNIKWVDIDPKTLNMDLDDLERKIGPRTKAIIGVHWGGYPLDLDRIKEIQQKSYLLYGFRPALIEDGAHAFGSEYKGKKLGNHGNLVMYSLQAIKHVTSVDGGILCLPHQKLFDRARLLRWYGINREDNRKDFRCETDIEEWGFKFHMNDVNATVGIENLKHADYIISKHRDNAKFYDDNLKNTPGVTLLERHPDHNSSFWIYSMLVENRDGFYKWMKECNITVSQVHERNDKHTCVKDYKSFLPNLDKTIGNIVSIPVGWWLTTEEREYIVECIKKGW